MNRPNVVVVVMDDAPIDAFTPMSYMAGNPQGDWVTFSNSIVQSPLCSPMRASMFSGLFTGNHGVTNNLNDDNLDLSKTLQVAMQRGGYRTGLFGKLINTPTIEAEHRQGWDDIKAFSGSPGYFNYSLDENGVVVDYGETDPDDYATDVIFGHAVDFIEANPEPFFCYIAPYAPHTVVTAKAAHAGTYTGHSFTRPPSWQEADISDKPQWLKDSNPNLPTNTTSIDIRHRDVWEALLGIDEQMEVLITALDNEGVLDNTVIVFVADNTNLFHEHRVVGKPYFYEESVNALMRIRYPGAGNSTSTALVCAVDIPATVADLGNVRLPLAPDGMSMVPLLDGTLDADSWREDLLVEIRDNLLTNSPDGYANRRRTSKYVEYDNGQVERYDLATDPYELANQGTSSSESARLARIKAAVGA